MITLIHFSVSNATTQSQQKVCGSLCGELKNHLNMLHLVKKIEYTVS